MVSKAAHVLSVIRSPHRPVGEISTPIALAVLRLMSSSDVVGSSTGNSPGFAPFRILSPRPAEPLAALAVGPSAAAVASRASGEIFGSGTGTGVCGNHGPAATAGSAGGARGGAGCFGAPH